MVLGIARVVTEDGVEVKGGITSGKSRLLEARIGPHPVCEGCVGGRRFVGSARPFPPACLWGSLGISRGVDSAR